MEVTEVFFSSYSLLCSIKSARKREKEENGIEGGCMVRVPCAILLPTCPPWSILRQTNLYPPPDPLLPSPVSAFPFIIKKEIQEKRVPKNNSRQNTADGLTLFTGAKMSCLGNQSLPPSMSLPFLVFLVPLHSLFCPLCFLFYIETNERHDVMQHTTYKVLVQFISHITF